MTDDVQDLFSKGMVALEKASNASPPEKQNHLQDAVWNFKQVLEINPNQLIAQRKLAHTYEQLQNYRAALTIYESILKSIPTDEMALYKIETLSRQLGETSTTQLASEKRIKLKISETLKQYESTEDVDSPERSLIHWHGKDSPTIDDEDLILTYEKMEFTAKELKGKDAVLILTNNRLILSGAQVYGSFTSDKIAREYEARRGKIRHMLTGAPMIEEPSQESLGISIRLDDIQEVHIVRFGKFMTLHMVYESYDIQPEEEPKHIGISNFGTGEAEKLFEYLKSNCRNLVQTSDEPFKLCSIFLALLGGILIFILGQILLLGVV